MKNQYLGDTRDLFKYDLISTFITQLDNIKNLKLIFMLTEDDNQYEGNKVDYNKAKCGFYNKELVNFLWINRNEGKDVSKMINFFKNFNIKTEIVSNIFNNDNRTEYFENITKHLPIKSLILLDPDNGLEVKNYSCKHLLYRELKLIYDTMDSDSIILVYQHFPRINRTIYVKNRINELNDQLNSKTTYISDNEIVFFIISKTQIQLNNILDILINYKKKYSNLVIENNVNYNLQLNMNFEPLTV